MRLSLSDLHVEYQTLANFRAEWDSKTAAVNNGVPIPLNIVGIQELPPLQLRLLVRNGRVGIGGDTWVVSRLVPLRRLGAVGTAPDSFIWEGRAKVYVCTQPWTSTHVQQLLTAAVAEHMATYNVTITT